MSIKLSKVANLSLLEYTFWVDYDEKLSYILVTLIQQWTINVILHISVAKPAYPYYMPELMLVFSLELFLWSANFCEFTATMMDLVLQVILSSL